MKTTARLALASLCLLAGAAARAADPPKMQFNEVKELAPGVFFRYSSIGPEGSKIPFGGSNNAWVVFEDYVLVFDANFPKEAGDVVAAIRKTTDKPIRYVLDSHHHGDHAYGNAVFAAAGATVVSSAGCARILRASGPKDFAEAGRGPTGRKDIAASSLKVPSLVFDDGLVLDDGKGQRAEMYFFGHGHTAGDAFLYLPKHKILCTGDACVNGAYNYMGQSDSASWIRILERAQGLDVALVCPGHGPVAGKDLLERQKRYFVELRRQVEAGIEAGKGLADIRKAIDMPWYKEWTTVNPSPANVEHVYNELTGRVAPWDLSEEFGVTEGPSPTKDTPGWKPPRRIVVTNLMPARLAELKGVAPEVEFVPVKTDEEAARAAPGADAVIGFCTPEIVRAAKGLRWVQVDSAGVDDYLFPEMVSGPVVLTNMKRMYGPNVADQAFSLLLALTRGLRESLPAQAADAAWRKPTGALQELHGKTVVVVGFGGIGTQIGRRAWGFGMRVVGVDPKDMEKPSFVLGLHKPADLMSLLPKADVVVLACPLTAETRGMFGAKHFGVMKKSAYFINIARGALVDTEAMTAALRNGRIAGAGMDVTEPEPLPDGHPLWKLPNCVISPHMGGHSPGARDRQWRLWRENVRRFAAGERLLCVVDKVRGY